MALGARLAPGQFLRPRAFTGWAGKKLKTERDALIPSLFG